MNSEQNAIIVFSKNGCAQCDMTKRRLQQHGLDFEVKMIDAAGAEGAANMAEFQTHGMRNLPVVVARGEKWAGFNPQRLDGLRATAH